MRKKSKPLWALNKGGEMIFPSLHDDIQKKYAPDSPFFHSIVPYIMLMVCAAIDFFVFKSKFDLIAYSGEMMKAFSIAGLLVGFDVVPIFTAIHFRKVEQGLSHARYLLGILLAVTILAMGLNGVICVATMDDMAPPKMENAFVVTQEDVADTQEETGPDAGVVAMTLFSCLVPMITSGASFCISYLTYDPLASRMKREDMMIRDKRDIIRRLDAVIMDYECDLDFAQRLDEIDQGKYLETTKLMLARALKYCDHVRQRIKEHLQNPAAGSALSAESCEEILKKLDRELEALNKMVEKVEKEQDEFKYHAQKAA